MGMAASQARYLGLSARKTNVEFEGQQVNQQRTALANESAGLFRKMLELSIPTAPSQSEFYTEEYVYADAESADGKVVVSGIQANEGSNPPTHTVQLTRKITVPQYSAVTGKNVFTYKAASNTSEFEIQLEDGTHYPLSSKINGISEDMAKQFNETGKAGYKNEANDVYYKFTNTASNVTYYINATKTGFDPTNDTTQVVDFFSVLPVQESETETVANATLGTSSSGLYNSITWTEEDGTVHNYKLTQTQKYDEQGYNDAMSNYNYQKALYDKEIADINAKTKELQETDRTLELRLKQLDTEQQALQTEMESIKKVIDKSVDTVFKTFQ